eukprot:scaffold53624_cov39-Phaeocystis_antarctica.AAC.1
MARSACPAWIIRRTSLVRVARLLLGLLEHGVVYSLAEIDDRVGERRAARARGAHARRGVAVVGRLLGYVKAAQVLLCARGAHLAEDIAVQLAQLSMRHARAQVQPVDVLRDDALHQAARRQRGEPAEEPTECRVARREREEAARAQGCPAARGSPGCWPTCSRLPPCRQPRAWQPAAAPPGVPPSAAAPPRPPRPPSRSPDPAAFAPPSGSWQSGGVPPPPDSPRAVRPPQPTALLREPLEPA